MRDVIDTYHGYQNMDSRVHPDVVRGIKAHNLISDVSLSNKMIYNVLIVIINTFKRRLCTKKIIITQEKLLFSHTL